LVLSVERAFGCRFSASEISKLKNVEGLVDLIRAKIADFQFHAASR
jgi:acyl carrier protein